MPMLREQGLLDNICRAVHNERSDVPKQCAALAVMVSFVLSGNMYRYELDCSLTHIFCSSLVSYRK